MRNVFLIPTDKPSKIGSCNNQLVFLPKHQNILVGHKDYPTINQNIYITSDETPKAGDYWIDKENIVQKTNFDLEYSHKIILTTDETLIKSGVQVIYDEFLNWFVNNPDCEWVEVKKFDPIYSHHNISSEFLYRIIIPQVKSKNDINTCYNFNEEIGCVQTDCRCEKEEPTMIDDWLNQYGDPEIYKKVEDKLSKQVICEQFTCKHTGYWDNPKCAVQCKNCKNLENLFKELEPKKEIIEEVAEKENKYNPHLSPSQRKIMAIRKEIAILVNEQGLGIGVARKMMNDKYGKGWRERGLVSNSDDQWSEEDLKPYFD